MSNTWGFRPNPTLFTPAQRGAALAMWFRGDAAHLTSGNVDTWTDQSGNGRDATQATAGRQPLLVVANAAYNGQNTLRFTSANFTNLAQASFGTPLAQPTTFYAVFSSTVPAVTQAIFESVFGNANRQGLEYFSGSNWGIYAGGSIISGSAIQTKRVVACVFNGASSAIYENDSTNATGSGNAGANSCGGITVGANSGSTSGLDGDLAEILCLQNADTQAQRQQMFSYLGARYGVAIS